MNEEKELSEFAENLWNNYLKGKVRELMRSHLSGFRAVVYANDGDGTLTVRRPFDYDKDGSPVSLTLPCAGSLSSAVVGTQVLVIVLGSLSNAFVLCKADLSNL